MPKISVKLSPDSIDAAIAQVRAYQSKVEKAGEIIASGLANMGYEVAYGILSGHIRSGETIGSLEVVQQGPTTYVVRAASQALLFFEFGAGVRYGGGHPLAGAMGYGPGTWPGEGHWDDPNGWWFPTSDADLIDYTDEHGQGWAHTYGNKPYMPFYRASRAMRENILSLAKEALT